MPQTWRRSNKRAYVCHFEHDWRTLAAINPAYRKYVDLEIAHLLPSCRLCTLHPWRVRQRLYTCSQLEAKAGQIAIAPAGVPHKFINSGEGPLKQIDIHASKQFITEWLED